MDFGEIFSNQQNSQEFIDFLYGALSNYQLGKLYIPYKAPATINEINRFTGFGVRTLGEPFSKGWDLHVEPSSDACFLLAFSTGTIIFDNDGGLDKIILSIADVLGDLVRRDSLPNWFPLPKYMVYSNVDTAETRRIITQYLTDNPQLTQAINNAQGHTGSDAPGPIALTNDFINGLIPGGIPVSAGTIISKGRVIGSGKSYFNISMPNDLSDSNELNFDLGLYVNHWENFFENLDNRPDQEHLKRKFAGPISNSVVRYINKSTGSTIGDFTNPSNPAISISIAHSRAQDYDTLLITDTAEYDESGLKIDKLINLASLNSSNIKETSADLFPKLTSSSTSYSVVRINKPEDFDSTKIGLVSITGLVIYGGNKEFALDIDDADGGGGVYIHKFDRVYIRNCNIKDNRVILEVLSTNESDLALLLKNSRGFGGGILCFHSSVYLYGNSITNNSSAGRGGGIGIYGYGWPVIEFNDINYNHSYGIRSDGGGIGIEIATPIETDMAVVNWLARFTTAINSPDMLRQNWDISDLSRARTNFVMILNNNIDNNIANDDGGGIYASVNSLVKIKNTRIINNHASNGGGGIRVTYNSKIIAVDCEISGNISFRSGDGSEENAGKPGGGGISSRNGHLELKNVEIRNNICRAWAGGGISINATSAGGPANNIFNRVLLAVFNYDTLHIKITGRNQTITENRCTLLSRQRIDRRKGGGIYIYRSWNRIQIEIANVSEIKENMLIDSPPGHSISELSFPTAENLYFDNNGTFYDDNSISSIITDNTLNLNLE